MKIYVTVLVLALLAGSAGWAAAAENGGEEPGETPLRAAIFVQNRAGEDYQDKIDVLNDLLTAPTPGGGQKARKGRSKG